MPERLRPLGTSLERQYPQGLFHPDLKSTLSPEVSEDRHILHGRTTYSHFVKFYSCRLYSCVTLRNCYVTHITVLTSTVGTSIYTVYSWYYCLHCLQQVQLSTVYSKYIYPHCLQQVQLSTLPTVDTALYSKYSYLHCLQ